MEKVVGAMVTFSLVIFSKQPMTETDSFFVNPLSLVPLLF